MAGEEVKDVLLRIRADATGLQAGKSGIVELNQAVELLKTGIGLAAGAFGQLTDSLKRGQEVTQLTAAFENLSTSVGLLADQQLTKLRAALGGTVSDLQIMEQANKAVLLGLDASKLDVMAESALKLGAAVGRTGTESFQDLVTGVGRGSALILDNLGVIVDTQAAYDTFAKKIGTTADALTEAGKKAAFQEVAFDAIKQKADSLPAPLDTAAKAFDRLTTYIENTGNQIAKAINENDDLTEALSKLGHQITEIDTKPLIDGISSIVSVMAQAISLAGDFGRGLEVIFNQSSRAQVYNIDKQLKFGDLIPGFGPEVRAKLEEQKAQILAAAKGQKDFNDTLKTTGDLFKSIYPESFDLFGKATQDTSKFIDTTKGAEKAAKAAKEAADEALKAFKKEGEGLIAIFENIPFIGEKSGGERNFKLEALDEAFQNSVGLFEDLLTPMFEGQAANFEDIFLDAAKRIAIGFGSQLLANVTASLGFGGAGGIGDAAGLGKALAASLGFGGGSQKGLEDFIGPLAGSGAGAGIAGGVGTGAASSLASLGPIFGSAAGGGVVIVATGAGAALMAQGVKEGNILKGGAGGTVAGGALLGGIGASILGPIGAGLSFFGGDSAKSQEAAARQALLDSLAEGGKLQFGGTRGQVSLDADNFNPSGKFGGQGTALVNPFAQILSGGDDKLGGDLAGIFENAVTSGDNFNETIVNTLALMDQLNITAEDAKPQLAELFLDGKIGIDEFSTGIANLNILATENLVGEGSVADAIAIVTSELASPRQQLKGLELAFKEMAEIGIDTTSEIHDYLSEHFSPDVVAAFDKLGAAGIDTFEEIANAGPDSLVTIFGPLRDLRKEFEETTKVAAELGNTDADNLASSLERVKKNAKEAREEMDKLAKAASQLSSGGGYNTNRAPNQVAEG